MAKRTKVVETPEDAQLRKVVELAVRETLHVSAQLDQAVERMKAAEADAMKYGMQVRVLERTARAELDLIRAEVKAKTDQLAALVAVGSEAAVDFYREWSDLPFGAREAALEAIEAYSRNYGDSSGWRFTGWARRISEPAEVA